MKDRMKVALRDTPPVSMDIDLLKSWVDPTERDFDDVLACIVINAEMKLRRKTESSKDCGNGTRSGFAKLYVEGE
jgi:hypothetical protein